MVEDMGAFIADMPKAELHVHLEGTLAPATIVELSERNDVALPYRSVADIEAALDFPDPFTANFLAMYYEVMEVLRTAEDFRRLTYEFLRTCRDNNVVYVETFFEPQPHTERGVPFEAVIEGIEEGRRDGQAAFGVEARLVLYLDRDRGADSAREVLAQSRPYRDSIIGVGMDGQRPENPPVSFLEVYRQARAEGYRLTAHCNQNATDVVEHIRQCLDPLGLDRIDHGYNVVDDPALIETVRSRGLCLTLCPHRRPADPGPRRLDALARMDALGLCVTINSDDPGMFASGYLTEMLTAVQAAAGLGADDLLRYMTNAFESAWMAPADRDAYLARLRAHAARHGVA